MSADRQAVEVTFAIRFVNGNFTRFAPLFVIFPVQGLTRLTPKSKNRLHLSGSML